MSMTMLTIIQILWVTAAYLAVTLLLPWLVLRTKLVKFRLPARFMAYIAAGNFFLIHLVYLLQLLHISNRVTLMIGTLLPFFVLAVVHRKQLLQQVERGLNRVSSFSEGELGARTAALHAGQNLQRSSAGWLNRLIAPRWLDVLLAACMVLLVLVMYGINTLSVYSYCAPDLTVHTAWISSMEHNQIFAEGVYPYGFHCMMYYLHVVFGIPVYVLLRVFAFSQTLLIHMMLLAFLKLVCKSKYAPYAGMTAYLTTGIFCGPVYYRYQAPLPQEYGMLFLLPAVYFAIVFLQGRNPAPDPEKKDRFQDPSVVSLVLFGMGVSLTLTIHLYAGIVMGLLCAGICLGFYFRCVRWPYLKRLLLTVAAGLLIGVLPMAAGLAAGIPFNEKQYWEERNTVSVFVEEAEPDEAAEAPVGTAEKILAAVGAYDTNQSTAAAVFILCSVGILLALGVLVHVLHRPDYGGVLVSFGVFMALACVIQAAAQFGLPPWVDALQLAVFVGYGLAVTWSLCIDAAAYLLFIDKRSIDLAGLAGLAAACLAVLLTGARAPARISTGEPNEAMICLTNILSENEGNSSWTVCSTDYERPIIRERGYHYELITFLRDLENPDPDTSLRIPTDTVYFFIEKVPLLFQSRISNAWPQREVSQEGANQPLPPGDGPSSYTGDARWVIMSRMYYWAEAFRKLYPQEMEIYYETDDFVCYRLRQDGYTLYDLAIDYGYNV